MPGYTSKKSHIVERYFTRDLTKPDSWKCICCKILTRKEGTGWTIQMNHLRSQQPEYKEGNSNDTVISEYFSKGENLKPNKVKNYFGWLHWVISGLKPFSFVKEPLTREYSKLEKISRNTLIIHIDKLTEVVDEKKSSSLPNKFADVIDGWTSGSTHFVGNFASYSKEYLSVGKNLLAFIPLANESCFGTQEHYDFLVFTLSVFKKDLSNIVTITGDNAEVNKSFGNKCQLPLIGCASHKFNLAVSSILF